MYPSSCIDFTTDEARDLVAQVKVLLAYHTIHGAKTREPMAGGPRVLRQRGLCGGNTGGSSDTGEAPGLGGPMH